jgi:putative intracellular protease/amidase
MQAVRIATSGASRRTCSCMLAGGDLRIGGWLGAARFRMYLRPPEPRGRWVDRGASSRIAPAWGIAAAVGVRCRSQRTARIKDEQRRVDGSRRRLSSLNAEPASEIRRKAVSHPGFRLGIYVFKDAEIVDFAAPHGVFSVARRYDPELEAFLIADAMRPVQAQAGFTVLPNYCFDDRPAMDAFLIPGGFGTRQEMHNRRLYEFVHSLPVECLLTSVCTGSWIYGRMGLLDGLPATNRKEPDKLESGPSGKVPIDRLAEIAPACRIQPRASRRCRAHRDRRRDHVRHGDGLSPAPSRRLRRALRGRGGTRHGVLRGVMLYRDDLETAVQTAPA